MTKSLVLAVLMVTGCASSPENLRRATATSIGGSTPPERVQVADVRRSALDVAWTAMADGKRYACSVDDMLHRPNCVRR